MRTFFPSESCKDTELKSINPQSWLQVERGKLSKISFDSSSSIESLIKVPEPPILPLFKPVDYVEVLAQFHEELEACSPQERSNLYLLQYQVFKGLGEVKLRRTSLHSAWLKASSVYEKLVFGAWLKYEKQGEELISDLMSSCGKCAKEFGMVDVASELPASTYLFSPGTLIKNGKDVSRTVSFKIGNEKIVCDRQKIADISAPFHAMLNGCFTESSLEEIDLSENNISPSGIKVISEFSVAGSLNEVPPNLLLEILVFANKFCCERLKDSCGRKLASLVSTRQDAVELMEYALEENSPVLAASCFQVFLHELPEYLNDSQVVRLLCNSSREQRSIMVGSAAFSLYSLLGEVTLNLDPRSDRAILMLEQFVDSAETTQQKMVAYHQLGYVRLS